jgi:hypothetical protein
MGREFVAKETLDIVNNAAEQMELQWLMSTWI